MYGSEKLYKVFQVDSDNFKHECVNEVYQEEASHARLSVQSYTEVSDHHTKTLSWFRR